MIHTIDRHALTTASPPLADLSCGETTSHLQRLEAFIMREVATEFRKPAMLYSIGKDSSPHHTARQRQSPPRPQPRSRLHP